MTNPYYYLDMIRQLEITPGSLVVVAADITRLALAGRRLEIGFDVNNFLDTLKQCFGKGGTLVIPSYNFTLRSNDHYSPNKTLPLTGALAVAALKRPEFIRTSNPLHSFLVWGEHAGELSNLSNRSSFDKDSPFAFFRDHGGKMLFIDTTVTAAFTFVHHVEEMEKVRYRKYKRLIINVEEGKRGKGEEGKRGKGEEWTRRQEVLLFAKKPGWTMDLKGLEELLVQEKVAKKMKINQVSFTLVDLAEAYPVIRNDIRNNKAGNIARFSAGLYFREIAKTSLGYIGIHTLADKISHDPGLL